MKVHFSGLLGVTCLSNFSLAEFKKEEAANINLAAANSLAKVSPDQTPSIELCALVQIVKKTNLKI